MKTTLLCLAGFVLVNCAAFGETTISRPTVECLHWRLSIKNDEATCRDIYVTAEISDGVNRQGLVGEILSLGSSEEDLKVAHGFCLKSGYRSAKSFSTYERGNAFKNGFFIFDGGMNLVKVVQRKSTEEEIGPIIQEIVCLNR